MRALCVVPETLRIFLVTRVTHVARDVFAGTPRCFRIRSVSTRRVSLTTTECFTAARTCSPTASVRGAGRGGAGQGRAGQGRAGQGRAGQGRGELGRAE